LVELSIERISLYDDTVAKAVELRQRNRELDDFAYVVSHDLKEPLIAIEGYSKILLSDFRQALDSTGTGHLEAVVQSAARMKNMIEDLLTLSRVGRVGGVLRRISVKEVLKEVLEDTEFILRERHATVELPAELPEVVYTRTELGIVFRNLIVNGVKFNSRQDPRVVVGVREDPGVFVFSVQDNGIGIEEKDFERVFEVFRRLHLREEYPGTGAGLTIVRKIVEAHGGKVWLESESGKGSTFFFTVISQQS
jgi:light-regulated signal transduction histidine kinase (bacteriophytochrome)